MKFTPAATASCTNATCSGVWLRRFVPRPIRTSSVSPSFAVTPLKVVRTDCDAGAPLGPPRPRSCHRRVFEVGDAGRLDGADLLELHLRVAEVVEETSTVAEQHRSDVELKLVQQS